MENKRFIILFFLLIVSDHFVASEILTNNEDDLWHNVTEISQLNGTWKGNVSETRSGPGITVDAKIDMILTINSSANIISQNVVMNNKFSGALLFVIWNQVRRRIADVPDFDAMVDNSTNTVTLTRNEGPRILDEDEIVRIKNHTMINKNGTKITWDFGEINITLIKQ